MTQEFHSAKKCRQCGQWSDWNQAANDTCQHCGALLDEATIRRQEEAKKPPRKKQIEIDLIQIYPTDGPLLKVWKYFVRSLQISFVAIVSFILWVLAMIAG